MNSPSPFLSSIEGTSPHVLLCYRAVHCGAPKWRCTWEVFPSCRRFLNVFFYPLLCHKHGARGVCPVGVHVSRCSRGKTRRSAVYVSVRGYILFTGQQQQQEVQPERGQQWPAAVRVLPSPTQGPPEDPGKRHEPVPAGTHHQRRGAAGGTGARGHVRTYAERTGTDAV